ncbi:glutaredoxin family protein [Rhodoferax aquaticus]|uniref:Glutaredoxin family protein n=1 Tax=Rhodoferax aquaticus TaxID=2527691 RepID=A0A515EP26_9BURK|nr:glutaredoxin family protein [Rhodoferax aquaticus]QDL54422.1 glutaredoxin family protein [Rhodoferax aquaticus]
MTVQLFKAKPALWLASALVLGFAVTASAQTVYRIVGPDGKVSFSDKPPANPEQGKIAATGIGAAGAASASNLPFELRQVVSKFPVTLYSSAKCGPCDSGRSMLTNRGIPFTEKTVNTNEDSEALQRLTGDTSLPVLTIGSQRLKGMSDAEWNQYLDAAGYPKSSQLPLGYRYAAATPLVQIAKPAPVAPKEKAPEPKVDLTAPPAFNPANPAGITF